MAYNIALLPGDGIGPEVIAEAVKVCNAVATKFNYEINWQHGLIGADAIRKTGDPYPDSTHELCKNSDAVLFGAVGDLEFDNNPKAKVRPEQGLLAMRQKLGLYANIRPVKVFSHLIDRSPLKKETVEAVDFVCIRELTGGIYFGDKGRSEDTNQAWDVCTYNRDEVIRILKTAFEYAQNRRGKLCIVDKANVLETSRLWRETGQQMSKDYPKVEVEYLFVDAAAMRLIINPKEFDVIVTENMFGDILTDEASVISGSMGLMPSASIGLHTSVFEPIHGSFPQGAGKNIANPMGTILSAAMLFDYALQLPKEAQIIEQAVEEAIKKNILTPDLNPSDKKYSTTDVGDWLVEYINTLKI